MEHNIQESGKRSCHQVKGRQDQELATINTYTVRVMFSEGPVWFTTASHERVAKKSSRNKLSPRE
jgi:hypothetical protein